MSCPLLPVLCEILVFPVLVFSQHWFFLLFFLFFAVCSSSIFVMLFDLLALHVLHYVTEQTTGAPGVLICEAGLSIGGSLSPSGLPIHTGWPAGKTPAFFEDVCPTALPGTIRSLDWLSWPVYLSTRNITQLCQPSKCMVCVCLLLYASHVYKGHYCG